MKDNNSHQIFEDIFLSLKNKNSISVFLYLIKNKESRNFDISLDLQIKPNYTSSILKKMVKAGLLSKKNQYFKGESKNSVYYSITPLASKIYNLIIENT